MIQHRLAISLEADAYRRFCVLEQLALLVRLERTDPAS